jgi:hypothetical protein
VVIFLDFAGLASISRRFFIYKVWINYAQIFDDEIQNNAALL